MSRSDETQNPKTGNFKNSPSSTKNRRGVAAPLPHLDEVRRHRLRRNLGILLPPLILLTLVTGYLALPVSKVAKVNVAGNHVVAVATVKSASGLNQHSYIPALWFNGDHINERLVKRVTRIADAKVKLNGLRTVTITVREHATVGYVQRGNQYHALLDDGTVVKRGIETPKAGALIFKGFGHQLKTVVRTVADFPGSIRRDISEVQSTRGGGNPYQIMLTMSDGNTIIADSRTVGKKIKYYPTIIKQVNKTGTVDLEVGAFFTPRPGK